MLFTHITLSHNYQLNLIFAKDHHRVKFQVAANFSAAHQKDPLQKLYCFPASTAVGLV